MSDTPTMEQLAQEVGAELVHSKRYGRLMIGKATLCYVNPTYLDFKADDVAKAPKAARDKLTVKGKRAHLALTEAKAAGTLLKVAAEAIR